MVKLHLPHIYMFLFNFLIWRKYNDDYVFIIIIVCFDDEFENEEGTRVFLLEAPNSFGWALQPLLAVEQELWRSWSQDSRKGAETSGCSAVKATKKAESVFEEVGTDPKNSKRKGLRGSRMIPKALKSSGVLYNRWGLLFSLKLSTKIMYICSKCNFTICVSVIFPISMQKTVRSQIRPVKKKLPCENMKKYRCFIKIVILI